VRREPRVRAGTDASALLAVDHLERMPEVRAALLLHLRDHDALPAPQDEIQLVPAGTHVRREQAIPTETVVEERAALPAVHAASVA
jgi:hypothetical protein